MGACRLSAKKVVRRQALKNLAKKLLGSFLLSICSRITTFKSSIPLPRRCQPGFLISTCAHGFSPFLFGSKQTLVIPADLRCLLPEAVYNQSIAALPQKPSVAKLSSLIANEGWSFTRGKDSPRVKVTPKRDAALYGFLMSVCTKSKVLLSSHAWSDIKFTVQRTKIPVGYFVESADQPGTCWLRETVNWYTTWQRGGRLKQ